MKHYKMTNNLKVTALFSLILLLVLFGSVEVFAGTSSKFSEFVKNNYTNKYGKIRTSSYKQKTIGNENFMKKKGVLTSIERDFDGDGSTECVVFYLQEKQAPNTTSSRKSSYVYADLLVLSENKVKKASTIKLYPITNFYSTDLRAYLCRKDTKNYIVLQLLYRLSGVPSDIAIIGIKNKKIYSQLVLWDPGYTSGQELYKYDTVKKITNMNYYTTSNSVRLFYDNDVNLSPLGELMNEELKNYGLKVTWQKAFIKSKTSNWMIKASDSTKKIFSIVGERVAHTGLNPSTAKITFSIKIDIPTLPSNKVIELSGYLGKPLQTVMKKFPGGKLSDDGWTYVYKSIEFEDIDLPMDNPMVTYIMITLTTEYSIEGITCGMSKSKVEKILLNKGWLRGQENYFKKPKKVAYDYDEIYLTYKNGYLSCIEYGGID